MSAPEVGDVITVNGESITVFGVRVDDLNGSIEVLIADDGNWIPLS